MLCLWYSNWIYVIEDTSLLFVFCISPIFTVQHRRRNVLNIVRGAGVARFRILGSQGGGWANFKLAVN